MSRLLEFEGTWEELIVHEPEFRGKKLKVTILETAEAQASTPPYPPAPSARELLKLPPEERSRILAAQAAIAEAVYRSDPELTAFGTFGEDDLYDEYPAHALDK